MTIARTPAAVALPPKALSAEDCSQTASVSTADSAARNERSPLGPGSAVRSACMPAEFNGMT